jgi:D-alanyl-D-alanine carboxypeptidase (penicillin-binding protein 5/6)
MTTTTPVAYEDGEVVGNLTWTAGPNTTTVDIELEGTISPPTAWWRLTHPLELVGE